MQVTYTIRKQGTDSISIGSFTLPDGQITLEGDCDTVSRIVEFLRKEYVLT